MNYLHLFAALLFFPLPVLVAQNISTTNPVMCSVQFPLSGDTESDSDGDSPSNKIIASTDAKSHSSFRGRDGGISQASLTPSITLALQSGIRISLGAGWTEKPEFHRDGTYLGIGYDFPLAPEIGASFSYTYLSYADSSTQNQSVFHHSIGSGVYIESSLATFAADIGVSIGSSVEYALTVNISHPFLFGKCSFHPLLAISWGEQNGELVAERIIKSEKASGKSNGKAKGNATGQQASSTTISVPKNIFSIMSYEIILPLSIHLDAWTITPSFTCIVPLNVIDGSREVPYINAGLTVVYELNL